MQIAVFLFFFCDLRRSHERNIEPESQAMHQTWMHHVELKGNLYPGTENHNQKIRLD